MAGFWEKDAYIWSHFHSLTIENNIVLNNQNNEEYLKKKIRNQSSKEWLRGVLGVYVKKV
jgi:hypothetical protein